MEKEKSKHPDRDTLTLKYDFFLLLRNKGFFIASAVSSFIHYHLTNHKIIMNEVEL
jgi:hypothetical protein